MEALSELSELKFEYGMTTNGMLLHKYMEYIADKKIHLLISLDGNEYNDSYRVMKNGQPSFSQVISNVETLRKKYPQYFEQYVNFNAVLHNRNSVKDIIFYIKNKFNKFPTISSLATNGIKKEKQKEFIKMFQNQLESYKEAESCFDTQKMFLQTPDSAMANFFINAYCNQTFRKYSDLFIYDSDKEYIPTGICIPIKRKLFLTVY